MNKKILVVCDGFLPPKAKVAGGKNIYLMHKYLAARNFKMHLAVVIDKQTAPNWLDWKKNEEKNPNLRFHIFNIPFKAVYPLHFFLKRFLLFFIILYLQIIHKFDLIHEYSSMPFLVNMTYILGWLTDTKTVHTLCAVNKSPFGSEKLLLKSTHRLICPSENMKNNLQSRIKTRIDFIPIPVEDNFFNFAPQNNYKAQLGIKTEKVVLFCGPLDFQKGVLTFLEAIPEVIRHNPDTSVVILTTPGLNTFAVSKYNREKVISLMRNYRERVIFIEEEVYMPSLFSAVDIFVYPLSTMHGTLASPSVLIESMAMGKAIVTSRLPELNTITKDGQNSLLFEAGNSRELYVLINKLLHDLELRRYLGEQARLDSQRYKVSVVCDKVINLYNELSGVDAK